VDHRSSWGEDWLYFHDDSGRLIAVRSSWTDAAGVDPFVAAARGRAMLRAEDLLRLAALASDLRKPGRV
jgi:hypothetical protein